MAYIETLNLNYFRSYQNLVLSHIPKKHIILTGKNGAGKTNILEALSLLSPGRGLRNARLPDMQQKKSTENNPWSVSVAMDTEYGLVRLGTGKDIEKNKRLIRINGHPAKTQSDLSEWASCLWLTPQMDRLFLDDKSSRRRFFDRLVFTFDPAHMGRLTRYENAMRQRLKLLKEGQNDPNWITALESQMAESAIAISAARLTYCEKLQYAYESATQKEKNNFPSAYLKMNGFLEHALAEDTSALNIEERFSEHLKHNRSKDAERGTTSLGPHRSDFLVLYSEKDMPADQSSTGEQKALLIGIILAHARLLQDNGGQAPLLLLDEVVAHLDPNRRKILADILKHYPSQVWMTGTDKTLFSDFEDSSTFYNVSESGSLSSAIIFSKA